VSLRRTVLLGRIVLLLALTPVAWPSALGAQPASGAGCDLCHGELEFLRQQVATLEEARRLLVTEAEVGGSAHQGLSCASCHGGFGRFPHPEAPRSTNSCASCHEASVDPWRAGVHGRPQETGEAAGCSSCHGVHDVARVADTGPAGLDGACLSCHATATLPPSDPHAEAVPCASCHEPHHTRSLEDPEGSLSPAQQARTCAACHEDAGRDAPLDAHGAALAALERSPGLAGLALRGDAPPTCTSCHGGHGVRAPSHEGFDQEMVGQCGACHQDAADSYFGTYHGKATALGSEIVATCDHCHGSHRIFPASDPRSAVAEESLVATCAACHEQSREAFVRYDSHPDPLDRSRNPPLFYSFVFMNVLLFGVLGVFALHTALWWVRLILDGRKQRRAGAASPGGSHE
jgi:hypothetical protein